MLELNKMSDITTITPSSGWCEFRKQRYLTTASNLFYFDFPLLRKDRTINMFNIPCDTDRPKQEEFAPKYPNKSLKIFSMDLIKI